MAASYTVEVRNPDFESANRIHGDEVARAHGFRGGLVPGVVTYAHMCPAVVVALGSEWIERGEASLRLSKPVYDGDVLEIATELTDGGAAVRAHNGAGEEVAVVTASVPPPRPRATEPAGLLLTPLHATLTAEEASPAGLLRLANRFVALHFDISPWIHAGSRVQHWHELTTGAEVEVQGAVASLTERGGHKLFDLDLVVHARGEPAAQIRHSVIYRLASR